ncbi:MAG: 6-carboxytetrahydropterin synthase [Psychrobium sp.]|nr:6-carboxytetrahydropterin synthase [Psychrobium sp.]
MKLFVNNLTVIDYSYLCHERGMVGESLIVDIELDGSLNDECMVLDFSLVKKQIKAVIDNEVDHKLLVATKHESISYNVLENETQILLDRPNELPIYLNCPHQAFALIDHDVIDEDAIIRHLEGAIRAVLPANVTGLVLKLAAEPMFGPFYHYSHGLKKHDGNCQRIAHGHRSIIEIERNGEKAEDLEAYWASRWTDIYLITKEDMVTSADITLPEPLEALRDVPNMYYVAYEAPQGRFELIVPQQVCEVLDFDTTVEQLTQFVAQTLAQDNPGDKIDVIGYEGVDKGAMVSWLVEKK